MTPGDVTANAGPQGDPEQLVARFRNGANWFFWIAGLSLVNSIVFLSGGELNFVVGLGLTQVIDGIAGVIAKEAKDAEMVVRVVAFGLDVVIAGFVVGFGVLARKGFDWAFLVGMVLYAIVGLIFLLVQAWLSIGFHVFALFCIWAGLKALRELRQYAAAASAAEPALSPALAEGDGVQG
jgi:hypothetical protein